MQNADLTEKLEHYRFKKIYNFLQVYVKMEKLIIKSGDIEIQKQKFYQQKEPISIKNRDINKVVVFNEASFGKKRT